jgi:hypothetical protein
MYSYLHKIFILAKSGCYSCIGLISSGLCCKEMMVVDLVPRGLGPARV